jgi:O-antigen/teichoic acid export membrane protein
MSLSAQAVQRLTGRFRSTTGRRLIYSTAAAVLTRLALLGLAILLARQFGPEGYGTFTFATGVALLGAQVALLGWPMLMNRLIPPLMRDRDWPGLKGLRDAGDFVVVFSGLAAATLLAAGALLVPRLRMDLMLAAALLIPFGFAIMRRQQLAAVQRPALGLLLDQGIGATLTLIVLLAVGSRSIEGVVLVFAAAIVVEATLSTALFRGRLPPELNHVPRRIDLRVWMAMALPMLAGMGAKLLMNKTDILMLAPLSDMHQVGLYGAALRITYLLIFPQLILMSVITPLISEAFAAREPSTVSRLIRRALGFALVTAIPLSLLIMMFPKFVMTTLFGPVFADAAFVLVVLTIAQLATSLAVPFQALLTMGGRERTYGTLHVFALIVHVLLNLVLVPLHGASGAAVSTAIISVFLLMAQIVLNHQLVFRQRPSL